MRRRSWATHGGVADVRVHATEVHCVPDDHEWRREDHVEPALLGLEREVAGEERGEGTDDVRRNRAQLELDGRLARVDGPNNGGLWKETVRPRRGVRKAGSARRTRLETAGDMSASAAAMIGRKERSVQEADTLHDDVVEEEDGR